MLARAELRLVNPHAMQDDRQLAGDRNPSARHATPFGHLHSPGAQRGPFRATKARGIRCEVGLLPAASDCLWRFGRDRKHYPRVPSPGAVHDDELEVDLQIDIALHVANWKQVSDLRSDGSDTWFEIAEEGGLTPVGSELLVVVADKPGLKLLPQKLRGTPIDVGIEIAKTWKEPSVRFSSWR
jgi:hypothetical protein